jgi:hypothetical protein
MEACPADVLEEFLLIFTAGRIDFCLFSTVPPHGKLWVLDTFLDRWNKQTSLNEKVSEGEKIYSKHSREMNCRVLVSNQDNCGVYSDRC